MLAVAAATVCAAGAAVPATAAPAVAPPVTMAGTYEVLAKDVTGPGGDLTHTYTDVLRVPGKAYPLRLPRGHGLAPGTRIRVSAQPDLTTSSLSVSSFQTLAPASTIGTAGTSSVLVILAYWSARDTMTPAKAAAQVFGDDDAWYREVSYGKAGLAGVVTPWVRIPAPEDGQCYAGAEQIRSDAETRAARLGAEYDASAYQRTIVYFPKCTGSDTTAVAGWAYEPGNIVWLNGVMDRRTSVHEIGHSLGLGHARSYACRSATGTPVTLSRSCTTAEYGDPYDAMGRSSYGAHFTGVRKDQLGWLGSRKRVMTTTSSTFTLPPFEKPSSLPLVVVAYSPAVTTRSYWLEYRRPVGRDARLPSGATGGVLIHLRDTGKPGWLLDGTPRDGTMSTAVLKAGTSWTAPDYVRFSVGTISSTGAHVTVTGARPGPSRPSAPRSLVATGGDRRVALSWVAPSSDGGAAVSGYDLVATSPSGTKVRATAAGTARSGAIGGLVNEVTYTVSVAARNVAGLGTAATATARTHVPHPTVTITSPASGATVHGGLAVAGLAAASAESGSPVSCVWAEVDGKDHQEQCWYWGSAPYTIGWNPGTVPSGKHTVTVGATDYEGHESPVVSRSVTLLDYPPAVTLTAPAGGTVVNAETVTLTATASVPGDPAATIDGVQFYDATGYYWEYLGGDGTAPYSLPWNVSHVEGTRTVVAQAHVAGGQYGTSAPVSVTVTHPPPTVAVTSPAAGSTVSGPSVRVAADAAATAPGVSVAGVRFYAEGSPIGYDTTAPYEVAWDTASVTGAHTLTARVEETSGRGRWSDPVAVTVANTLPAVSVTSPVPGVTVFPAPTQISGTAVAGHGGEAPDRVVVTVGGVPHEVVPAADGTWSVPWDATGLSGWYAVTVAAYTPGGLRASGTWQYLVQRYAPALTLSAPAYDQVLRRGTTFDVVVGLAPAAGDPTTVAVACPRLYYAGTPAAARTCATAPGKDGLYHLTLTPPSSTTSDYLYVDVTMSDGYEYGYYVRWVGFADPPAAPAVTVTPSDSALTADFSADGRGATVTSYVVTADHRTQTVTGTRATFTGLTNGTAYAVSVYAVNALGPGPTTTVMATAGVPTSLAVVATPPSPVPYGSSASMTGRLTQADGTYLPGQEVTLRACDASGCATAATGTTDASGLVTLAARIVGETTTLTLRFAGTARLLPSATPEAWWSHVVVVPVPVASFPSETVAYGTAAAAEGRLEPAVGGRDVVLYRWVNGWVYVGAATTREDGTFTTPAAVYPRGTWRFRVSYYHPAYSYYTYSEEFPLTVT